MLDVELWNFEKRYMYIATWEPSFDVITRHYTKLLVWVDILFRVLVIKVVCLPIIASLGKVLLYLRGDHHSSYPHNRVCVLKDLSKVIPQSVKINLSNEVTIWKPLVFKNLPFNSHASFSTTIVI